MLYRSNTTKRNIIIAVLLFVLAGIMHQVVQFFSDNFSSFMAFLVDMIYIGIALLWMGSVERRVIHTYSKRMLLMIGGFILFWLIIRIIRYDMTDEIPMIGHYLWYMYYIPMILIPLFSLMATCSIGNNSDTFKKHPIKYLLIPAICMIVLVLTNDIHKLVFGYDTLNYETVANFHTYNWGYYLIVAWMAILMLISLIIIVRKCKVQETKRMIYVPAIVLIFGIIVTVLQVLGLQQFYNLPESVSFTFLFTFESCIQLGFIPANIEYEKYFELSNMIAVIKDDHNEVKLASKLSKEYAMDHPTLPWVKREIPLSFGSVLWLEDTSLIMKLKEELESIQQQLSEEGTLLLAENNLKERRSRIEEKAKLYDELSMFAKKHIEEIHVWIDRSMQDTSNKKEHLMYACILTAYVKRRCNLMLLQKENPMIDMGELYNCLRETMDYINFAGTKTSIHGRREGMVLVKDVIDIYDAIEVIGESIQKYVTFMNVYVDIEGDTPLVRIMVSANKLVKIPTDILPRVYVNVLEEDETYYINVGIKKVGDSL